MTIDSFKDLRHWDKLSFFRLDIIPLVIAICFLILIASMSLYKSVQLSKAEGHELIEGLGGKRLGVRYTYQGVFGKRQQERLQEALTAAASDLKIPRPRLYVLPMEKSINSMSCGLSPAKSAICVTYGVLAHLGAEEFYDLMAFEVLRIKNGRTALQTRLVGRLHGFFFISMLGRQMTYGKAWRWTPWLMELALRFLGGIGFWLGRWFQAWFAFGEAYAADYDASEFLASRQTAINRVLKKVLGCAHLGRIKYSITANLRPLFFVSPEYQSWLNCHPPLRERIEADDPKWLGSRDAILPIETRYMDGKEI
ncbi:MAG: M48 family metalloprotease [Deltaproteobacteria bacterium]|nr:M48 family metalloprotease [Deltaproteobacteria bacterium]